MTYVNHVSHCRCVVNAVNNELDELQKTSRTHWPQVRQTSIGRTTLQMAKAARSVANRGRIEASYFTTDAAGVGARPRGAATPRARRSGARDRRFSTAPVFNPGHLAPYLTYVNHVYHGVTNAGLRDDRDWHCSRSIARRGSDRRTWSVRATRNVYVTQYST